MGEKICVVDKALRPGAQPRFDTIARVCSALGVRLVAQSVHEPVA